MIQGLAWGEFEGSLLCHSEYSVTVTVTVTVTEDLCDRDGKGGTHWVLLLTQLLCVLCSVWYTSFTGHRLWILSNYSSFWYSLFAGHRLCFLINYTDCFVPLIDTLSVPWTFPSHRSYVLITYQKSDCEKTELTTNYVEFTQLATCNIFITVQKAVFIAFSFW